ncbi:hypothetical protein HBA54_13535 [Pelagibius litoralis]|uniref:Uncharacterized protein n=1 Tax=Pelagibius litoralis TaxID=374515 RepID=A0A967EY75_9PROT|nr:hypothetical protein [Pelagibius litoralis]NIA69618.1 hypothetical protein [Pelagibius litoralis]
MMKGTHGIALKVLLLFLGLWLAAMALALPQAALEDDETGLVLAVFPLQLPEDGNLLNIAAAEGRAVRSLLGGRLWLTQSDRPGFVRQLKSAGAWAAFDPGILIGLPQGGCFFISVHPPGPPRPHPPI